MLNKNIFLIQSKKMSNLTSKIIGVGGYLPNKIITNFDLEKMVDTSDYLLDFSEDMDPILSFFNNQRPVFDSASELLKNMYVQTTLSSSLLRKKFLTPFQIMHSKNNSLRDILHYSKNNDKITKSEKKIKSRLLTIRSYSTKNDNRITNENIFIKNDSNSMSKFKNLRSNNSHKIILRKVIKQNKQNRNILPASNYLSTTMPLIKNINGKNHNNNYLRSVGNEKYLLRYKSIEKMNFKPIAQFKANCYYNKLKLKKVDNILKKYSYADS